MVDKNKHWVDGKKLLVIYCIVIVSFHFSLKYCLGVLLLLRQLLFGVTNPKETEWGNGSSEEQVNAAFLNRVFTVFRKKQFGQDLPSLISAT